MITGNRYFNCSFEDYCNRPKAGIYARMRMMGILQSVPLAVDDSSPLNAYVNHGRWLVKCECGGCEYAWEEKLFMCQSCWNSGHKHKLRRVAFPLYRKAIEMMLAQRPLINRNWKPGETIDRLRKENREHINELLEVS